MDSNLFKYIFEQQCLMSFEIYLCYVQVNYNKLQEEDQIIMVIQLTLPLYVDQKD